jgi:hypothetical protein
MQFRVQVWLALELKWVVLPIYNPKLPRDKSMIEVVFPDLEDRT